MQVACNDRYGSLVLLVNGATCQIERRRRGRGGVEQRRGLWQDEAKEGVGAE